MKSNPVKKRESGIPAGNAGEYFVMGELLRRGFDAQLADRNTKGYDMLVGSAEKLSLWKVQVKTVRRGRSWYVNLASFKGASRKQITVYVLLGAIDGTKPVRFFIAGNRALAKHVKRLSGWGKYGFMPLKVLERHENRWDILAHD